MRKKILTIMAVLFALCVIGFIYKLQTDYYVKFDAKIPDMVTVEYGEKFEMPEVHAVAKHYLLGKKKDVEVSTEGTVDESKIGEYKIVFLAEYRKKEIHAEMNVKVTDSQKPVLTMLGKAEQTIEAGMDYVEAGYTADDNYDGDLTGKVKTDGEVDVKKTGDYVLTYTVEDSSGNKAEEKRTIHVVDTTAPIITLAGENTVYVQKGESYTEAGYMAQDGCDGDITDRVTVSGDVDTSTAGSYILTYEVKDSSGNEASMQRTVRVYAPVQVNTVDPGNKVVYLTFDDGPGPYTAQLLDVLDKYNVKATFFVTNTRPDYRTMIAEEAKRGHTVAIHSASHVYSQIYQSEDAYFADLEEMNQIIIEQTGQGAQIIRFPGGSSNTVSAKYSRGIMSRLVKDVEARGFLYCDWNVSSGDAGSRPISTQQVVQNVTEGMQKNNVSIVLQHDIKEFSVNAVEQIIQWGLAEGYTFLPLSTSSPMSHHGVNN